ncbi:hypothetical protein FSP39_011494 [Pinctada imbricata]|uniref:C2H2-type domain-containing protein n=1 Tax=Pinctada imbricata TaxID=66713 RepID=A0AA88YIJ8_PINIB|nr:hypothetical protein FSP39_011494 [Pinctada imbricata]
MTVENADRKTLSMDGKTIKRPIATPIGPSLPVTSIPTLLELTKSEQYRRMLSFISSTNASYPRLCFQAIRCTLPNCPCECFSPGKVYLRSCDSCKHGWVAHALDKLGYRHIYNLGMSVEVVQPNIVFDIASLMLYGTHATPIRLKILLDRLFSVLQHDEVLQILQGFGWTYEDYARGYILQDSNGQVLDKWTIATREEEHVILQQFLRFGETKSIAQEIILQDTKDQQEMFLKHTGRSDSEIKKFIERNNHTMQSYMRTLESRHLFGSRIPFVPIPGRMLSPGSLACFSPPTSASRDLRPPLVATGLGASSPGSTSPLGRLQTMQPFEFRRDHSPAPSPETAEKNLTESSPCGSPQNLSSTPTSSQSITPPFTPIKSSESRDHLSPNPMTLPIMPPQDDHVTRALDFTTGKEPSHSPSSIFSDRKLKHLRKSSNPIKRHWNPSPGFGSTLVGPNGKKRVLCTACNKTFCDKGALKIHYSAVHLKEMHKCTVEGCNMMFSSRRSRNRHSANPNPKLHMPQKRVKLPDGASLIDDGSDKSNRMRAGSPPPTMVMPPTLGPHGTIPPLDAQDLHPASQATFYAEMNAQMSMFPTPEKRIKLDQGDDGPKDLSMPPRREIETKFDNGMAKDDIKSDSPVSQRSMSRRKNNIPTRLAPSEEENNVLSDEEKDGELKIDTKYSRRRSRIAEAGAMDGLDVDDKLRASSQRYYLNLSMSDDDRMESSSDVSEGFKSVGLPRKDFPKIASLLSRSGVKDLTSQEAIDYTTKFKERKVDYPPSPGSTSDSDDGSNHVGLSNGCTLKNDRIDPDTCSVCGEVFQNAKDLDIHFKTDHLNHTSKEAILNDALNLRRRNVDSGNESHEDMSSDEENFPDNDVGNVQQADDNDTEDEENHCPLNGNKCHAEEDSDDDDDMPQGKELNEICLEENEISVFCHICQSKFKDNLALKEHFEMHHPKETFNCTVTGCEKIFSTRKSRNRHSQNDNLHRHLASGRQNGVS